MSKNIFYFRFLSFPARDPRAAPSRLVRSLFSFALVRCDDRLALVRGSQVGDFIIVVIYHRQWSWMKFPIEPTQANKYPSLESTGNFLR